MVLEPVQYKVEPHKRLRWVHIGHALVPSGAPGMRPPIIVIPHRYNTSLIFHCIVLVVCLTVRLVGHGYPSLHFP